MKKIFLFICFFVFFVFIKCSSIAGIESTVEANKYKVSNLTVDGAKNQLEKGASTIAESLSDSLKQSLLISLEDYNSQYVSDSLSIEERDALTEEYYVKYVDSLKQTLNEEGSVKIRPDEAFLIDYLKPKEEQDTIFLANLFVETLTRGMPLTFQYNVLKNDKILFEFETKKSRAIEKIEIVEGAESRFNYMNLKKNQEIKGEFVVQSDNILTINVIKSGFFKSLVKMKIRKLPKAKTIVAKIVNDTIFETKKIVEQICDTLFTKVDVKSYYLSPRLDITNSNKIDFPIEINDINNLIGWGYWLGLNENDIIEYQKIAENIDETDPLIGFIKSEMNLIDDRIYLPKAQNDNINYQIKNFTTDSPSLNTSSNFGFYYTDSISNNTKAKIYISNKSKLYDYNINLLLVAVNLEFSQAEIEKEFIKEVEKIKLTLVN